MPHNNVDSRHDELKEERSVAHKNHHVITVTPTDPVVGFTTVDDPSSGASRSYASSVNDSGTIVGSYSAADESSHGFIDQSGTISDFSLPGGTSTSLSGINDQGTLIGEDSSGGFIDQSGTVTVITATEQIGPNTKTISVSPNGINDSNEVVGSYWVVGNNQIGFIYEAGQLTSFRVPGAEVGSQPNAVNDQGVIVGQYSNSSGTHGFVDQGGVFTTLNAPGAGTGPSAYTSANGIDNAGDIVGNFGESSGFLLKNGQYTTYNAPGATSTTITSINENGTEVAGSYTTADGLSHGFIAGISGNSIS